MRFEEFKKGLTHLELVSKGWRSYVYKALFEGKKVAVKVAKGNNLKYAIRKEAQILTKLRGIKNFPQIVACGEDFIVYEFIEGLPLEKCCLTNKEKKRVYKKVLELAFLLDKMCVSREEFQRLDKNIIISKGGEVYVIDFERGNVNCTRKKNVPQLIQLFRREGYISFDEAIRLGKEYGKGPERVFQELKGKLDKSL
ncbi:MAG: RIO1 family regulatory kinase/ATPase [Aquificaceae bacterium]